MMEQRNKFKFFFFSGFRAECSRILSGSLFGDHMGKQLFLGVVNGLQGEMGF